MTLKFAFDSKKKFWGQDDAEHNVLPSKCLINYLLLNY